MKWYWWALIAVALVGYGFYVYEHESVTIVEIIIGVILAILGVIAAYILRRK